MPVMLDAFNSRDLAKISILVPWAYSTAPEGV
jgi:hypothetical protein